VPIVQIPSGVFSAPVYEQFLGPVEHGAGFQPGANLKLLFTPHIDLASSRDIRLLQFTDPIIPPGWAVDRSDAAAIWPYFGWGNNGAPMAFPAPPGAASLAREAHRCGAGGVTTGRRVAEAFLVDAPRELTGAPVIDANGRPSWTERRAFFTVYARDLTNNVWLGGVSWGYILAWNNGEPHVTLLELSVRSRTTPPGYFPPHQGVPATEESLAAANWGAAPAPGHVAVPGRVPVPGW
jgi:hypothetical protein